MIVVYWHHIEEIQGEIHFKTALKLHQVNANPRGTQKCCNEQNN